MHSPGIGHTWSRFRSPSLCPAASRRSARWESEEQRWRLLGKTQPGAGLLQATEKRPPWEEFPRKSLACQKRSPLPAAQRINANHHGRPVQWGPLPSHGGC